WSFLRRKDAETRLGDGLIEGTCPNCGAKIEMNQNANCAHCGAMLRSGLFDWVLTEITQESEWAGSDRTDLPSVRTLVARDPEFNLQDLEDRASVMFWRLAAAERLRKNDTLRKIATPEFCEAFTRPDESYLGDRAVGAVDTLGIAFDDQWTRALVEV